MQSDATPVRISEQLAAAFNARDAAKLASLYTENATLMPPNQAMVRGRCAIEAWFRPALERLGRIQIIPLRSAILGEEAFEVGTFVTTAKADESVQHFKYALALKRVGLQWQID